MPLTKFQSKVAKLLAQNRSLDSFLAGGAGLSFSPNFNRYSSDLDYFNDTIELVATTFAKDQKVLENNKVQVEVIMSQPGFIRVVASSKNESTKIEWVHDTDWRFLPASYNENAGFILSPIDLAINKLLALVGRNEPRDFIDILFCHKNILKLGALCWAAVAKDPGFTPFSLLEMLKRRGSYRQDDFDRLQLTKKINIIELKKQWLDGLNEAEVFINSRDLKEVGCLYYMDLKDKVTHDSNLFFMPNLGDEYLIHYGCRGGVLPMIG